MTEIYTKWVATMQPLLESQYDFESVCSTGELLITDENYAKWALGDLALLVDTEYGQDRLGEFADRIGEKKGTLSNRRALSEFWTPATRWELINECQNIKYSHFKVAHRLAKKISDNDDDRLHIASSFILECSDNDWKVAQAERELKLRTGSNPEYTKILDGFALAKSEYTKMNMTIIEGDIAPIEPDKKYRIVIYKINQ